MNRTNQYKQRHIPFGNAGARMVRAQEIEDRRRERRDERFSRFRNDSIEKNDINEGKLVFYFTEYPIHFIIIKLIIRLILFMFEM